MGFIVLDGATYLLLVLILIFHYDLIHANALKMLLAVATTLVPILMFTGHGSIRWPQGLIMSAGSIAGGYIGRGSPCMNGQNSGSTAFWLRSYCWKLSTWAFNT